MLLWGAFAVELGILLGLQLQWRLAERRGGGGWLERIAEAPIERAEAIGARRRAGDPRLPLADSLIRRRGYWLTLVFAMILAAPAIAAVVLAGLRWAVAFVAWFATLWFGLDVLVLAAGIVMLWRGWLPPLDGGEGPEDPDPAPEPSDPWSRAHLYRLGR